MDIIYRFLMLLCIVISLTSCAGYGLHFSVRDFDAGLGHVDYREVGQRSLGCRVGDRIYECEKL